MSDSGLHAFCPGGLDFKSNILMILIVGLYENTCKTNNAIFKVFLNTGVAIFTNAIITEVIFAFQIIPFKNTLHIHVWYIFELYIITISEFPQNFFR